MFRQNLMNMSGAAIYVGNIIFRIKDSLDCLYVILSVHLYVKKSEYFNSKQYGKHIVEELNACLNQYNRLKYYLTLAYFEGSFIWVLCLRYCYPSCFILYIIAKKEFSSRLQSLMQFSYLRAKLGRNRVNGRQLFYTF